MLQGGRGISVYPYISFIEFSKLLTPLFLYKCSRGPEEASDSTIFIITTVATATTCHSHLLPYSCLPLLFILSYYL